MNCIAFTPEATHMFTCSNDGSIAAIRCGNWQIEKHWRTAHKGLAVNTVAIHPTGKIALSTGADGILRTWNLVKGRQAYATNLTPRLKLDARNVTVLKWSPNGEKYLLAVNQQLDIYSIELAGIDSEIKLNAKIVCVEFLKNDLIAVGLENGQICFYDLEKSEQTVEAIAHDIRVKCMSFMGDLLVTASSSGEIKLWRYSKNSLDMLQSVNCGARITCLTLTIACNNFLRDKEVKSEEEKEEIEKRKFRFRQEVIVEKEGDWDVTPIEVVQSGLANKNKKKRRYVVEADHQTVPDKKRKESSTLEKKKKKRKESVEEEERDRVESIPKKKKKVRKDWVIEGEKNKMKKRKRNIIAMEQTDGSAVKKAKKAIRFENKNTSRTNDVTTNSLKTKSIRSEKNDDKISVKRKIKSFKQLEAIEVISKKKKK